MGNIYVTTATLTDKRTLILDEPLPRLSKRVRLTIEEYKALPKAQEAAPFLTKLQSIHQTLSASGYQPRSKKAIDAQIREERDSWGK